MNSMEKSILATLCYYDSLDFPMTTFEIFKYRIPASRFEKKGGRDNFAEFNYQEVVGCLKKLKSAGFVDEKNGFFMFSGRKELYDARINAQKIADQKWKKALRYLKWLQAAPFIETIFISGSLAMDNTNPESDLDVLIVAKSSRIWTCRFVVSIILSVLGARRTKYEKSAPDKVCLNHYITEKSLYIPFKSIYTAHLYRHLVPVWYKNRETISKFEEENRWIKEYVNFSELPKHIRYRRVKKVCALTLVAKAGEQILKSRFGNSVEKILKFMQYRRIIKDSNFGKSGGRITVSDSQLEFHPSSPEKEIIEKFNNTVRKIPALSGYFEIDSGLN